MGWCHREICETLDRFLEDVAAGRSPRLIICMPPRSGKSEIISRRFPAYALGRYPEMSIIACSYASSLSSQFNREVQHIIDSEAYAEVFPETHLCGKGDDPRYVRTSDYFEVVGHNGSYRSSGVGGGITGQGADILIIDDAVKDRADADSQTVRDSTWDWYTSTAYTRLSPKSGVIVMGTRWHMDDLVGRLIEKGRTGEGDKFAVISYPAIAETDEAHRKEGEALHPERYSLDKLLTIRRTVGSRDWEALYQQHPVPDGGALFRREWFKEWTSTSIPEQFDQIVQSWDMTFKDSSTSDYVVGQVWGRKGADFYLLDQIRGRYDFVETRERFKVLTQKWPKATRKLVEDKANGTAIIAELKSIIPGIVPVTPHESKEARASAVTPYFEAGNVYLPSEGEAYWCGDFKSELLNFPSGAHDDQVDACSQALNFFREHRTIHWSRYGDAVSRPPR